MTFKEKIVNLRKLKAMTQDEFAKAVGVSRQAVYKWESGQSYPEVPKLLEIKALFGVSIDDLLDEGYEVVLPEKKRRKAKKVESASTEIKAEQPVATVENEVVTPDVTETKVEDAVEEKVESKKVGFFGRLFGRK